MLEYVLSPYLNKAKKEDLRAEFSQTQLAKVRQYHATYPQYQVTPLYQLTSLAGILGIKDLYVKDEAWRFGLNAFKVLGASYAIARYIAEKNKLAFSEISYQSISQAHLPPTTFATSTDGNHGRGVAWTAQLLGQKAVVNMPKGTVPERVKAIEEFGAQVTVTDFNYDETVRLTAQQAQENGWVVVQDTAWPGYQEIPLWIMKGYGTLAVETKEQLPKAPTHVFLQAGVGSLAAAVVAAFVNLYPEDPPFFVLLEAEAAACFYQSAKVSCEEPLAVAGDLKTIMAGLACGEASPLAWPILHNYVAAYFAAADPVAACGMRILANPLGNDAKIMAGESGAAGLGLVYFLSQKKYQAAAEKIKLDENSVVLLLNTEGATDKENYRSVVWEGLYPAPV